MTTGSITVTLGVKLTNGAYVPAANHETTNYQPKAANAQGGVPSGTLVTDQASVASYLSTVNADVTPVASAVSTLVADGATPTQAHVTTLNTAWGTLNTAVTALATPVATVTSDVATLPAGDVTITYDESVVTTREALAAALRAALRIVDGSGTLT